MSNRQKIALFIVITIVTRLALAFRPETQLTQRLYQEDAYYALATANHLAHGNGFSVDGVHPTNGVQPLIVVLYSICFFISGADKWLGVRLTFGLVAIIESLCVVLIYKAIETFKREDKKYSIDPAIIGAGVWTFLFANLIHNAIGLETGLYAMMILWSLYLYGRILQLERKGSDISTLRWIGFGVQLGLLVLTRIDGVFFVAAVCVVELIKRRKIWPSLLIGAFAVVVSSPWWVYNYTKFGSLMPISGQSESIGSALLLNIQFSLTTIANIFLVLFYQESELTVNILRLSTVAIIIIISMTLWRRQGRAYVRNSYYARPLATLFIASACLIVYYTFFFNAPHFIGRYFHPLRVAVLLVVVMYIPGLYDRWKRSSKFSVLRIAMVSYLLLGVVYNTVHYIYNYTTKDINALYQAGRWAEEHPQHKIGMTSSGVAGFMSDNVVNLDGKVNYDALLARHHDSLGYYVVHSGIDVLADWEGNARPIITQAQKLGVTYYVVDSLGSSGLYFYLKENPKAIFGQPAF
ncbi:MAG TPA: hypothetical protein VFO76_08015 [Candidatus Kapabacteria bacterium]|nr:hypothetical protein [Candidatus Kapabacteria bacterium]